MRKNLLTVATMAVVAFFVSTEIAKATDVSFSGQIRTRWDAMEQFTNIGTNETDDAVFSSVRLGAQLGLSDSEGNAISSLKVSRPQGPQTREYSH